MLFIVLIINSRTIVNSGKNRNATSNNSKNSKNSNDSCQLSFPFLSFPWRSIIVVVIKRPNLDLLTPNLLAFVSSTSNRTLRPSVTLTCCRNPPAPRYRSPKPRSSTWLAGCMEGRHGSLKSLRIIWIPALAFKTPNKMVVSTFAVSIQALFRTRGLSLNPERLDHHLPNP